MIKVDIVIRELSTAPGRKRGVLECKVDTTDPSGEEIHVLARLFEKLRELGTEMGGEKGGKANIVEFHKPKDVRPEQSEGDRRTDSDR